MKPVHGVLAVLAIAISGSSSAADTYEFTLKGGIKVRIVEEPFDETKHKITYCENTVPCPCRVDGVWQIGTAPCQMPSNQLTELVVTIAGQAHALDTSHMYNAWEGRPPVIGKHKTFTVTCDAKLCTVRGAFSDGAGGYVAEWQIKEGQSKRTLLSADEEIAFPFMEAMDKQ